MLIGELTQRDRWEEKELLHLAQQNQLRCHGRVVGVDRWTRLQIRLFLEKGQAFLELDAGKGFRRLSDEDWMGLGWVCLQRVVYAVPEELFFFQFPQPIESAQLKRWRQDWEVVGQWQEPCTRVVEILHPLGHLLRASLRASSGHRGLQGSAEEQDLFAVGYSRRGSQGDYGLDGGRAEESLALLHMSGWEILFRGLPVIPQTEETLTLDAGGVLKGTVNFERHQVAVEVAWQSPQQILCPFPGGWGLFTPSSLRPWVKQAGSCVRVPAAVVGSSVLDGVKVSESARRWMGLDVPEEPSLLFQGVLRPYQREGMRWLLQLAARGGGGLLADEMGLGKTVQVLAAISHLSGPILIVVPTSLLENWRREWCRFLPGRSLRVHHGTSRAQTLGSLLEDPSGDVAVLTTPARVREDKWLADAEWQAVVLDEAHLLKNHEAATTQAFHRLKAAFRVLMTGTPLENRPEELWTHLSFLDAEMAGEREVFAAHFQQERSRASLQQTWKGWMRRRKKSEVAQELPPLLEQEIFLDPEEDQWALHEAIRRGQLEELESVLDDEQGTPSSAPLLVRLTRLRQLCCSPRLLGQESLGPKLLQLEQDIAEAVAQGQSVVVFSQFVSLLSLGRQFCGDSSRMLSGQTRNRQEIVDQFQRGDFPVLFCSLKAAGVGLNLQRADLVILLEPWWNRAAERQAIDRAHRIGRHAPVLVKRYLLAGSIEERIRALQEKKEEWAQSWWSAAEGDADPSEDLAALLLGS